MPEFIKRRGCINCESYIEFKRIKEGESNHQLHELMTRCLLMACTNYGHNVMKPFIHPDELDQYVSNRGNNEEEVQQARKYRAQITSKFKEAT